MGDGDPREPKRQRNSEYYVKNKGKIAKPIRPARKLKNQSAMLDIDENMVCGTPTKLGVTQPCIPPAATGQTQENPGGMRHDLIAQTNFRKAVSLNQITGQTQENPGGMRHDLIAQTNFRKAVSLNQITGQTQENPGGMRHDLIAQTNFRKAVSLNQITGQQEIHIELTDILAVLHLV
nr:uncharacterized protein LOC127302006 isoform X2 [Lolium perenne]